MKVTKKMLLLALLPLAATTASHAQSRLGLKAGATLSRYVGNKFSSNETDTDQLAGFMAGVSYNLPFTDDGFFSLQPELLFVQKGAKITDPNSAGTSRLSYLDLPILARIKAGPLVLEAGPQVGYLLSHSGNYTGGAQMASYENFSLGAVAGVGFQAAQGYTLGVRYNRGLNALFSSVQGGQVNPFNSSFQLYAGYVFGQR